MSREERIKIKVASYVVVKKDDEILFMRRYNTGWEDGSLTLPSGHIDQGETALEAAVRELREETALDIDPSKFKFFHTHYQKNEYVDFFFSVDITDQKPKLCEPDKASELVWLSLEDDLSEVIEKIKTAVILGIKKKELISYS